MLNKSVNEPPIMLFLCGDVMIARGIDQAMAHSVDPILYESYVKDARDYLKLAFRKNGNFRTPVSFSYIWGDAMEIWGRMSPDLKIINLETSITTHDQPWKGKGIHYRMHPENVQVLTAAGIDFCALANNHTLDWEREGLTQTIQTLADSGIKSGGSGKNSEEASALQFFSLAKGRVIVLTFGAKSSGIPGAWEAREDRSGINMLPESVEDAVDLIRRQLAGIKQKNDIVVFSVHWGGNWGYGIPPDHRELAHQLIERAGVDLVYGHSSHHPMGLEVYRNKLIIYGAGDFINDYEGIGGKESFRADLSLMYFPRIDPSNGELLSLKLVPMKIQQFRLNHADKSDASWLEALLNREGNPLGTWVERNEDKTMDLQWSHENPDSRK